MKTITLQEFEVFSFMSDMQFYNMRRDISDFVPDDDDDLRVRTLDKQLGEKLGIVLKDGHRLRFEWKLKKGLN